MDVEEILKKYRVKGSLQSKLLASLQHLSGIIACEASSLFILDEHEGSLRFYAGTNTRSDISIPLFGPEKHLWKKYKNRVVAKVNIAAKKNTAEISEVFFENISEVKSLVYCPIFDDKNNPIGIIRLINRMNKKGNIHSFTYKDLSIISEFSNLVGAIVTISLLQTNTEAFFESVTHELLAPVAAIKNTCQFLKRFIKEKRFKTSKDFEGILLEKNYDLFNFSQQAISLIQGFTWYSKSGEMTFNDLETKPSQLKHDIVTPCRSSISPLLYSRGFRHSSIVCIDSHLWPLFLIDRKVFRQVFHNLLTNSIKYAFMDPRAFTIKIKIELFLDSSAVITVSDYGIGIKSDEAPKIFEATYRGHEARKRVTTGTGIGLTIVRNLLRTHECKIALTRLQTPTEFTIKIPKKFVIRRR